MFNSIALITADPILKCYANIFYVGCNLCMFSIALITADSNAQMLYKYVEGNPLVWQPAHNVI